MLDFKNILNQRSKRVIVVDFDQALLTIACAESRLEGCRLLAWGTQKISLAQEDIKAIAALITNFKVENNITARDAVLSLSDTDSVVIKYIVMPALPQEEIMEAAKWQLKEEVHFDLTDAIVDWQVVREYTDEEGDKKNGMVFVIAKREVIEKCLSIAAECHLNVLEITTAPFSQFNLIKRVPQKSPVAAILNISHNESTISIYMNGKLCLVRELPFSMEKLIQALRGVLVSDKGRIELSLEEAENIVDTVGIPQDKNQAIKNNIYGGHIISLVRPLLEVLTRELKFSFDYFISSFDLPGPTLTYITGFGALLKNLDTYLSKELNTQLIPLPMPERLEAVNLLQNHHHKIANVLGAALESRSAVNLLPQEIKEARAALLAGASLRVGAIILTAVFLFMLFVAQLQIKDYQNRFNIAQIHLQTIGDIEVTRQNIQSRENLVAAIQQSEIHTEGILKAVSVMISRQIVLDNLEVTKAGHSLHLRGKIFAEEQAAEAALTKFMQKMEVSPFFAGVSLLSSRANGPIQEFEINCDLAHE